MNNEADILNEIGQKEDFSEDIAEKVINKPQFLPIILGGVYSDTSKVKFRSAKILRIISEKNPKLLYSHMNFFIELLDNDNKIIMWNAMDVIANLSSVDSENKINEIFESFYSFIYDESMITAGHVIDNSWKIAKSKPEYQKRITDKLLELEKIPRDQECLNILLGKTILSFDKYFPEIQNKDEVIALVKRQQNNSRNATKVKADRFLKKHLNQEK